MTENIINNIVVQLPYNQYKTKRISDTNFTIPKYNEYMLLIKNNQLHTQIKLLNKHLILEVYN